MRLMLSVILCFICLIEIKGDKASTVVAFAKSKLGCGYIWTGKGQICTEELIEEYHKKYPEHVGKSTVRKWLGKQVYDCSGLVMKAFEKVNIKLIHNSQSAWKHTNWAKSGTISNYPKDKVVILYRFSKTKNKMEHSGIYIGGGMFIHAKGSKYGVVMEKMPFSWTHWGIPKGLY